MKPDGDGDDLVPTAETQPASGGSTSRPPPSMGERYRMIERLDEGAMGVVWVAEDTALHRRVAIKLLHDRFLGAELQDQLAREARAMARLSHPNVVAVHDVGEREGRAFVAMELVEGQPLSRWLETPRSWQEVLEVFRQIGAGLAAAHAAGVVHRDIKPSNILIGDDGRPRIADFGVAHAGRRTGGDAPVTATSTRGRIGSPAYMPPERLHGDPAGVRGDQFAYCAALYEALHGERPFQAQTVDGLVAAIARGAPPPVREVPPWLHAAIARGLAADPADRYPSMTALLDALRPPPPRSRAPMLVTLGVAGGAAIAAVAILVLSGPADRRPPPVLAVEDVPLPDAANLRMNVHSQNPDAAAPAAITEPSPPDAGHPNVPPDAAPKQKPRTAPDTSLAELTPDQLKAKFQAMVADLKQAAGAKDYHQASRIAEKIIPVARAYRANPAEYEKLAITYACLGGEAQRARSRFAKMPDGVYPYEQFRYTAREICARNGITFDP